MSNLLKTVKEVSALTGISVRTLHYYDEIDLLKPAHTASDNGYRYYDEASLIKLQQILFYKELGFPLKDIKTMLNNPSYDYLAALKMQKELLTARRNRLDEIINLITDIQKGEITMNFEVFHQKDLEEIFEITKNNFIESGKIDLFKELYGDDEQTAFKKFEESMSQKGSEIINLYGSKEKALQALRQPPLPPQTHQQITKRNEEIFTYIGQNQELSPSSVQIQTLVKEYADSFKILLEIDDPTPILTELADTYTQNQEVITNTDQHYGPGSAQQIGKALKEYLIDITKK